MAEREREHRIGYKRNLDPKATFRERERESGWYLTLHVHRRKFGTERRIDGRRVYLRIVHLCGDSALMEAGEGRRRSFIAIDERPHEIYPETG